MNPKTKVSLFQSQLSWCRINSSTTNAAMIFGPFFVDDVVALSEEGVADEGLVGVDAEFGNSDDMRGPGWRGIKRAVVSTGENACDGSAAFTETT